MPRSSSTRRQSNHHGHRDQSPIVSSPTTTTTSTPRYFFSSPCAIAAVSKSPPSPVASNVYASNVYRPPSPVHSVVAGASHLYQASQVNGHQTALVPAYQPQTTLVPYHTPHQVSDAGSTMPPIQENHSVITLVNQTESPHYEDGSVRDGCFKNALESEIADLLVGMREPEYSSSPNHDTDTDHDGWSFDDSISLLTNDLESMVVDDSQRVAKRNISQAIQSDYHGSLARYEKKKADP
jgi:hypothetical protein